MKHILVAAIVAAAQASPVSGEVFRLTCTEFEREGSEIFLLDSFRRTAFLETLHIWEDGVVSHWDERMIIWGFTHSVHSGAILHVFFRETGVLQKVIIEQASINAKSYFCQLS